MPKRTRKQKRPGYQLFNNAPSGTPKTAKTGYGTAEKARQTLKRIRSKPRVYQHQVATTMFFRAKYHKYQTKGMREAMKVYGRFLKTLRKHKGGASSILENWVHRSKPAYVEEIEGRSTPLPADLL